MENLEQSECFDSSPIPPSPTSELLTQTLPEDSSAGEGEDVGNPAGATPKSSRHLLSWLQKLITEIEDIGGIKVRYFETPTMLKIGFEGVKACHVHKLFHAEQSCPLCK